MNVRNAIVCTAVLGCGLLLSACVGTNFGGKLHAVGVKRAVPERTVVDPEQREQLYVIDGGYYARVPVKFLPARENWLYRIEIKPTGIRRPDYRIPADIASIKTEYYYCKLSAWGAENLEQLDNSRQHDGPQVVPEAQLHRHQQVVALNRRAKYTPWSYRDIPERKSALHYVLLPVAGAAYVVDTATLIVDGVFNVLLAVPVLLGAGISSMSDPGGAVAP